ncbi:hypothetical protein CEP52_017555 [Fusarium oligoseptatum]|uniref:Chromo domain-containing protein n=1 Tax=Fusarium oligoseptatum TaxID=2604345 RepID=A0A428RNT5_9HYPO|nr:hypothetical protein CEP52_017555 [Fusarium oligoseptatum]
MVTDGMAKQRREKRKFKSESDIFIVDSIQEHFNIVLSQGNTKFRVKWQGYEAEKDWTWEPLENLRTPGEEMIRDYFDRLAGKPSALAAQASRVRTSPLRGGREFGILRDSYNTTTPAFHVSDHLST